MHRVPVLVLVVALAGCVPEGEPEAPLELMELTYLVFATAGGEELGSNVTLANEPRPALVAPIPAEFRFRARVPERPVLTFALGITEAPGATGEERLPASRMRFTVRAGRDTPDEIVFERDIHVARRNRWIEQNVDVRRFAGREIWLSFLTSFPGADDASGELPVIGVFGEPVLHDRAAFRDGRAVVIVSIDTLRRDHVSLYGYRRRTTPGLDAFSGEGVVFEDAISTSSWTLPAHASLLTSTYPSVNGAVNLNVGLSSEWPNLASVLREDGFFTQAMVTHLYLSEAYGFDEGFDRHLYLPETRAQEVTNHAVRFLQSKGDRDFFLFLHYYDPHWHYDPPPPYDRMFDPSYDGSVSGIWWEFKDLAPGEVEPRDLRHIEALYDGEIRYTDRHLERLFQEMKRLGVFDKSLIVVTSDHGEEFLDHGGWEHQKTLYEEQLRVPLVVKFPRGEASARSISEQVSLIDIAPTVVDVLGLPEPPTFQGRSLREVIRGRGAGGGTTTRWAETEHTLDGSHKIALRRRADAPKAIFRLQGKKVETEVYHLGRDPMEREAIKEPTIVEEQRHRLDAFLAEVARRREGKKQSPEVELSPEEWERLRSLGYLR